MNSGVRARRIALGLSQAELGTAAGLSRQLVAAVEAGRHSPSVRAALALASALGTTVEDLFAKTVADEVSIGATPAPGTPVVGAAVGDRVCYAALPDRGAEVGSWRPADGVFGAGRVTLFPGARPNGAMVAGCDPALGLAASMLPGRGPQRLVAVHASSGVAVGALTDGRLHAALVHGPPDALGDAGGMLRWRLAAWEVGLAAVSGAPLDLEPVAAGRLRVARREPGAAAQQALERAVARLGAPVHTRGPLAAGHLDAARRVVYGTADVAVTMRAAAIAYGLEFAPIERHVVELHIDPRWVHHPGIVALGDLVASKSFRARLGSLGGYDL
jgi:DNA-binding XRE family transcriptional regulator